MAPPRPAAAVTRFEKLFDLRQDVLRYLFQFASVLDFANFCGDRAANIFARRHGGRGDRVGPFETYPHDAQISAASPAKLARLSFL